MRDFSDKPWGVDDISDFMSKVNNAPTAADPMDGWTMPPYDQDVELPAEAADLPSAPAQRFGRYEIHGAVSDKVAERTAKAVEAIEKVLGAELHEFLEIVEYAQAPVLTELYGILRFTSPAIYEQFQAIIGALIVNSAGSAILGLEHYGWEFD